MSLGLAVETYGLIQISGGSYLSLDLSLMVLVRLSDLSLSYSFRMRKPFPFSRPKINGQDGVNELNSLLYASFNYYQLLMKLHEGYIGIVQFVVHKVVMKWSGKRAQYPVNGIRLLNLNTKVSHSIKLCFHLMKIHTYRFPSLCLHSIRDLVILNLSVFTLGMMDLKRILEFLVGRRRGGWRLVLLFGINIYKMRFRLVWYNNSLKIITLDKII